MLWLVLFILATAFAVLYALSTISNALGGASFIFRLIIMMGFILLAVWSYRHL